MKKGSKTPKKGFTSEDIYKLLLSVDARITNIEERLSDMATKDNLDYMRNKIEERIQEVRLEVRALGRAIDKDSLAILDFEKRIGRIEKRVVAQ
ncbi:hypothetical protein A3B35_03035 [Candidatus Kaiserbacteria bacterium RIFCSPLOWO2_01_FULL_54_24]|uniref:Uncharacterized protein n=1 Tax=Candidatus Kaiserbacteria bacterium RIFCSPLOWO2_01_FULL_54_24 TaxID=1798515 RepID=A0A1F6ET31_9BACT|nr:MAG: hypothetical protein A3B35_03035 [Candidatus Kaiserbacteria bacterium RIFCSPLOWO2_01_FULL_54_24]